MQIAIKTNDNRLKGMAFYAIAIVALVMGLISGVLIMIDNDMEAAPSAMKASALLTGLEIGLFICGVSAGFGGLIRALKYKTTTIIKILSLVMLGIFLISVAIGLLTISELKSPTYDNLDRIPAFLSPFVQGLFYSGLVYGFISIIAMQTPNRNVIKYPKGRPFYLLSFVVLGASVSQSILMLSDVGNYVSVSGWISFFITAILQHGIMFSVILAAFGVYISSQPAPTEQICPNCAYEVLDNWKVCPYCEKRLIEFN